VPPPAQTAAFLRLSAKRQAKNSRVSRKASLGKVPVDEACHVKRQARIRGSIQVMSSKAR
ncbi:hypothetical protein, partial [Mesorhizobium sp.]|uniref:hypothetical protein n=1 Tax=Mesorhizobium sp. TaxID=1871066 RepID=UPI00257DB1EE